MDASSTDPDVLLMLRCQAGEVDAFTTLVTSYQDRILNLVYRYTGDATGAEDLAQEIFVKAYGARATYTPKAKFVTWLYTIATRHCLNAIRDRSKRKTVPLPDEEVATAPALRAAGDGPAAALERGELHAIVRAALDALPPNQRMAVILEKWEDCSYEQISQTMGLSIPAVKSLLSRAREGLRERLERHVMGKA
ncbi:MAG: sigma-70 family RNA polymerase sigma factor [Planctomycetes bacterium]|nr:sigma-70 family RNA polymerase sigma factor [Planctomycetota bacterium]